MMRIFSKAGLPGSLLFQKRSKKELTGRPLFLSVQPGNNRTEPLDRRRRWGRAPARSALARPMFMSGVPALTVAALRCVRRRRSNRCGIAFGAYRYLNFSCVTEVAVCARFLLR
jgi:hypothetical protein